MQSTFPNLSGFEHSVVPWIGKIGKLLGIHLKDAFAAVGVEMTREQFIVLKVLHDKDGAMQKELAFITERNKGSLARLISTLEKKGYVERKTPNADRRIKQIFLTKEGRAIFKKIKPVLYEVFVKVECGLSTFEIEQTIHILRKIEYNIQNATP